MSAEFPRFYQLPTGQELTIRPTEPASAGPVLELLRDAYTDTYAGDSALKNGEPYVIQEQDVSALLDPRDPETTADWSGAFARATTDDGKHEVLRLSAYGSRGVLLGYTAVKHRGEPGNDIICPGDVAYDAAIHEIAVARHARRTAHAASKGVGTALMHASVSFLAATYGEKSSASLLVVRQNRVAQGWYARSGWMYTGHYTEVKWPNGIVLSQVEMEATTGRLQSTLQRRHSWLNGIEIRTLRPRDRQE